MSYIYTLRSKYLNALNDVIKKITITENAKVIKNPLLEADNNFTSIVQSDNQFDPSKINSNVLADETNTQEDEKKLEKKNKLKTMVLNKIKQSLEISDDLQAMLKEIDDINKDSNLNEWILNEKGNTAELKNKNAAIFKQNNQLCLSHNGKVEIFHSVPELHEWLKKNNYPLPKNIKLHESVNLKEAGDDDFDPENDYMELNDKGEQYYDQWASSDDEPKKASSGLSKYINHIHINPAPDKFNTLGDRYRHYDQFYGNGYGRMMANRHNFTKNYNDDSKLQPYEFAAEKKKLQAEYNNLLNTPIKLSDGKELPLSDAEQFKQNSNNILLKGKKILSYDGMIYSKKHEKEWNNAIQAIKDLHLPMHIEDSTNEAGHQTKKLILDDKEMMSQYLSELENDVNNVDERKAQLDSIKTKIHSFFSNKYKPSDMNLSLVPVDNAPPHTYARYNPYNVDASHLAKNFFDDLDVTLELPSVEELDNIKGYEEDFGGTTIASIGPAVQYTANKPLEETDELTETVLIASGPKGEDKYKYYGWDEQTGNLITDPTKAPKLIHREDVVNYWLNILNRINEHARNNALTDPEKRFYKLLSSSGMMNRNDTNSFISQLFQMREDNFTSDEGSYQYQLKNAKFGKNQKSRFDKHINAKGETEYSDFNNKYTILNDIYHDFNTDDVSKRFYKTDKEVLNKLNELKDHLASKYDLPENMPYTINNLEKWFLLPEFVKEHKDRFKDWANGVLWVYGPKGEYEFEEADFFADEETKAKKEEERKKKNAYCYDSLRTVVDEKGKRTKLPEFDAFLNDFKKAMVEECYKKTVGYKKIDKMYEQLDNLINKKVHEVNTDIEEVKKFQNVDKNKTTSKLYNDFEKLSKESPSKVMPFIFDTLNRFIYTSKISNDLKSELIDKMLDSSAELGLDSEALAELKNIKNRINYISLNTKNEAINEYNLDLLKQDLSQHFSQKQYNLDLLKQDLNLFQQNANNQQKTLTEDESPEDFASGLDMNTNSDSSETSTDMGSDSDIDLDTDSETASPDANFGDINVGNFGGEYGPDEGGEEEIPTEPETNEKIIDVLENEDGDIKVKVQDLDTDQVTIKDLNEIDV